MRLISAVQHSLAVSLLTKGCFQHKIQTRTGLGKGSVGQGSDRVSQQHPETWDICERTVVPHRADPQQFPEPEVRLMPNPLGHKLGFHHFWIISDGTHCHNPA